MPQSTDDHSKAVSKKPLKASAASQPNVIHWFRRDLRLRDNPALVAAAKEAKRGALLPLFIFDDDQVVDPYSSPSEQRCAMGEASRVWLHHSLQALNEQLDGKLACYQGDALPLLKRLVEQFNIEVITWNRCYEPAQIERDKTIKQWFKEQGVSVITTNGSLLWEPWEVYNKERKPYKVFTPFYNKGCLAAEEPREPLAMPKGLKCSAPPSDALTISELNLLPSLPWGSTIIDGWSIGELGARKRLQTFIKRTLDDYVDHRDFPEHEGTSGLSPHLHFGELSPNQVWHAVKADQQKRAGASSARSSREQQPAQAENHLNYLRQLGWREFSYSLLYHNPTLQFENLKEKFNHFPWLKGSAAQEALQAWQQGQTGIPIVDAGMRQLWQTGTMHNRIRMVVGSFLVKNLLIHWSHGERWFWDCLLDADHAINSTSWQWVAGTGTDAAPYFRVFNPVLQGKKFDAEGRYIRHYVPELERVPTTYIFEPWEAPESVLAQAGVRLGRDYPEPLVNLKSSRLRALGAFESLKEVSD